MTTIETESADPSPAAADALSVAQRHWRLAAFLRDRAAVAAACLLIAVTLAAALAPLISLYTPYDADNAMRFAPPGTSGHILGTDQQGRDMMARLIWGGRVSLLIGVVPTLLASTLGLVLDWGAMIADGRVVLRRAAHVTIEPGILILAVSLAFNFLGDGLRDALDPRSARR
jgi:peptide/nickel transport system permease protein